MKKPDEEVPGWHGYSWSEVVRPAGGPLLGNILEMAYPTSVPLCCDKTAHFRVALIPMLFNQHVDMSQLSGGWIIWEKEKGSLTWTEHELICAQNVREISFL